MTGRNVDDRTDVPGSEQELITIGLQRSRLDPQRVVASAPVAEQPVTEQGDRRHRLPFDPIAAAAHSWEQRWPERDRMEAVTSLMRVHQLVITELDERLRPLELTFARFEVLVLLAFSRRGSLPLGKIGERLQVHATSVTPLVKRLEASGYLTRNRHPEDGRAVLAEITPAGRQVTERARKVITDAQFGLGSLDEEQCRNLTAMLAAPRAAAGDF